MTYRGHVKNGQIALDEPTALPEGAEVSVQVLERADVKKIHRYSRRQILQMPIDQRRELLIRQSERLADSYTADPQRIDWQGGDVLE
ncbi:MAG TPA: hypothetical protein VK797_18370 [Tepidisphaeraceae bacterium]|jgi:hypothetical protein|nr:hypothetical protein [Tepidisphaeraceae bacterium]